MKDIGFQTFKTFIDVITQFDTPDAKICFQTLHDYDKHQKGWYKFYDKDNLEEVYNELSNNNSDGYCCSLTLHEMGKDEEGTYRRRKKNCERIRCFCIDFDAYLTLNEIKSLKEKLSPTIVVRSSTHPTEDRDKVHFYFVIEGDKDWQDWVFKNYSLYQCALATAAEKFLDQEDVTDKQLTDLARAMRSPGFMHQKNRGNQAPVLLMTSSGPTLTKEGFDRLVETLGITDKMLRELKVGGTDIHKKIEQDEDFYEVVEKGNQNNKLFLQARRMFRQGRHYEEVLGTCLYLDRHYHTEPLQESNPGEIESIVENTYNRHLELDTYLNKRAARQGKQAGSVALFKEATKNLVLAKPGFKYDLSDEAIYAFPESDEAVMDRFMQKYGDNYILVGETLMAYDEKEGFWIKDNANTTTPRFLDVIKDMSTDLAVRESCIDQKGQFSPQKYRTLITHLKSFRKQAQFRQALRVQPNLIKETMELDGDPYLINCQNGVVDLKDLSLRPHDRKHLMASQINAKFPTNADDIQRYAELEPKDWKTAGLWTRCIWEWMEQDLPLARYFQKVCGSVLKAGNDEECIFFLYGTGKNGKSKAILGMEELMGSYGRTIHPEVFACKEGFDNRLLSELSASVTKRVVFSSETDRQRQWNDGFVKRLTGKDKITVKKYFEDTQESKVRFTPFIMGNYRPIIGNDEGIWRRFRLIPFNYRIPEEKRDNTLDEKLKAPRVLQEIFTWALAGYKMYKEEGLTPPMAAQEAIEDYRKDMNPVESMLMESFESCDIREGMTVEEAINYFNHYWRHEGSHDTIKSTKQMMNILREIGVQRQNVNSRRLGKKARLIAYRIQSKWADEFEKAQKGGGNKVVSLLG